MLGLPIGTRAGFLLGGWIAKNWGWQRCVLRRRCARHRCARSRRSCMREPKRGGSETARHRRDQARGLAVSAWCCRFRRMWPIIASGALHNFNMYAIGSFLAPLLMRYHGTDIAQAG